MDWSKVQKVPKYNPMMFTLVRNLDGRTKLEQAKLVGLSTKTISAIEAGEREPTEDEFQKLFKSQDHVLETFYMQWHEHETRFTDCIGVPVKINYYKFKIFRDVNPPPLVIV